MYFLDSCQYNIAVSFCSNVMGQNETKTTFCFCRMTARIFNVSRFAPHYTNRGATRVKHGIIRLQQKR